MQVAGVSSSVEGGVHENQCSINSAYLPEMYLFLSFVVSTTIGLFFKQWINRPVCRRPRDFSSEAVECIKSAVIPDLFAIVDLAGSPMPYAARISNSGFSAFCSSSSSSSSSSMVYIFWFIYLVVVEGLKRGFSAFTRGFSAFPVDNVGIFGDNSGSQAARSAI